MGNGASLAIAFGGWIGSACAVEPPAKSLTDVRQETQIWTTYALSPDLLLYDLKVSGRDGKAVLCGTVTLYG
jgi:hyperosmotically inducible protein